MKKILMIGILGLLFYNTSFADSLRVVDGDTIVLNGEKIRFSGIDTPELKQTCMKDNEKIFCGETAKILLIKKIGNKIDEKIKSGDIKESELMMEATDLMNKMKEMPGMGNMNEMLNKMAGGMGGKGSKFNMNAFNQKSAHINQMCHDLS